MKSSGRLVLGGVSLLLILVAVALLVFYLPWRVPLSQPVKSVSYTFGFNNAVAMGGVGAGLLMLLGWHLLGRRLARKSGSRSKLLEFLPRLSADDAEDQQPGRWYARPLPWFALLSTVVVLAWWRYIPFPYFGETANFLGRLDLMALGLRPDVDFQFNYGSLMLQIPHGVTSLSLGSISLEHAYILFLVFNYVLGFVLLDYLAKFFSRDLLFRWAVFLTLGLPLIKLTLGVNYAPLRFVLAPAALLFVHRRYCAARGPLAGVLTFLLVALLSVLGLAFSPEMGLAFCAAMIVYSAHSFLFRRRGTCLWLAAVMGAMTLLVTTRGGAYDAVVSFGSGGNNFPVFPTMAVLVMLVCAMILLPALAASALLEPRHRHASLWLGLAALAAVLMVPALGRADGGHVHFNGITILLLALAAAHRQNRRLFLVFALLLVAVLGGLEWIAFAGHYGKSLRWAAQTRRSLGQHRAQHGASWDRQWFKLHERHSAPYALCWSKTIPFSPDLRRLDALPRVGIPLGAPMDVRRYLLISRKLHTEYYPYPVPELFTAADAKRKAADLKGMKYVLVPADYQRHRTPPDAATQASETSDFLSQLLLFPVQMEVVNPPFEPLKPAADLLATRFRAVGRFRNLLLMRRMDSAIPKPDKPSKGPRMQTTELSVIQRFAGQILHATGAGAAPAVRVIRDQAAYETLIAALPGQRVQQKQPAPPSVDPLLKQPKIDFQRQMLVLAVRHATFQKTRIKRVLVRGEELIIEVLDPAPSARGLAARADAGTYEAVLVPRSAKNPVLRTVRAR